MPFNASRAHAGLNLLAVAARHREPRDIAFDVGHEHRHTKPREAFGQHHQRHCLAGAGGAGHQPVPVAVLRVQVDGFFALAEEDAIHVRRLAYDKALIEDGERRQNSRARARPGGQMDGRQKVFISYSHDDTRWLQEMKQQLAVLEAEGLLSICEDTQLEAGTAWYERLHEAMLSAKLGLLLVSSSFLDFSVCPTRRSPSALQPARGSWNEDLPAACPTLSMGAGSMAQAPAIAPPGLEEPRQASVSAFSGAAREQVLVNVANEIAGLLQSNACAYRLRYASSSDRLTRYDEPIFFAGSSPDSMMASTSGSGTLRRRATSAGDSSSAAPTPPCA